MRSPSSLHKNWTLAAVCMGTFMLLLNITIVVVALPAMQVSLHADYEQLQWTYDAYALSLASVLLATGSLADMYGRKRVFALGLTVFTVALPLCASAQSGLMLIVCQAILGLGGAAMFSTSLALLAQTFRGHERGNALGVWGLVGAVATGLGPVLGGALTNYLSWRWVFLINVPIGIVAIVITLLYVQESRPPHARRLDVSGLMLFSTGLFSLVFGLIRAGEHAWTDPVVLVCLLLAVVLLTGFVLVERHSDHPMFDLALFRVPSFLGAASGAFGIQVSLYAVMVTLVVYMQSILRYSPIRAGLAMAAITGATMVTAPLAGRLSTRMPVRLLVGGGLLAVGIGLLLMRGFDADTTIPELLPGFIVAGLASGLVNAPVASAAVGVVPPHQVGIGSGINNTFRQVGVATGVAALGSILANHVAGARDVPRSVAYADGIDLVLVIGAVLAFVTGTLALALIRGRDFVAHDEPDVAEARPAGPGSGGVA